MAQWESGRESHLLDAIIAGKKTVEGRLNKGKFARYVVGDTVSLRRDYRTQSGELVDGESGAAVVEITAIRRYPDFLSMVTHEGFNSVIPDARSIEEATDAYNRYYSYEDQETYGVLAIEIKLL
jgi:ASC-1-like (ASCH) protein